MDKMEAGEKVLVEAKNIPLLPDSGWRTSKEREILLSGNQAGWVAKALEIRNKTFGKIIRRDEMVLDGKKLVVMEGRNQKGIFLAIQVRESSKDCCFVIVPAGFRGKHWLKISRLIGLVIQSEINPMPDSVSIGKKDSTNRRSYADTVRGNPLDEKVVTSLDLLQSKLELLELEIGTLRTQIFGKNNGIAAVSEPEPVAATNPTLGKKGGNPSDGDMQDPTVRFKSGQSSALDNICRLFICAIANICMTNLSDDFVAGTGCKAYCEMSPERDDSSNSQDTSLEEASNADSSEEDDEDIKDEEEDEDNDSVSSIFWDEEKEVYAHSCGMSYDPVRKRFSTRIVNETDDLRSLYFVPKDRSLQLALEGKLGAMNQQISQEEGWDLSNPIKWNLTAPPNLLEISEKEFIEDEIS